MADLHPVQRRSLGCRHQAHGAGGRNGAGPDKKRRLFIEAKNHAEAMIHQIWKTLESAGVTVPAAEKTEAESAVASARAAMDGDGHDQLTRCTERMSQAAIKIGKSAHRVQGQAGTPPGGNP